MPFNGSGVYSAPSSPGAFNPATAGGSADPTSWNALLTDLSTALSTTITRDGQTTITQNIPFNTKKITGLGPGTALTDAANISQIVSSSLTGAADTGAADAYAIAPTVAISAYAAYQSFQFVAAHANTTTSTLAVSGLAVKTIKRPNGDNLAANDILAGAVVDVIYDGTNFILLCGGTNAINNSLLTTRGDIIYRGASLPTRLAVGTNHQVLITNGTDPSWGQVDLTAGVTGVLPNANFALSAITNSLSGDVNTNNTSNYFDGPSVAQGATGTWFASGTVTVQLGTAGAITDYKLWDGTTVIDSASLGDGTTVDGAFAVVSLSGYIASPAANIRISVKNESSTSGKILFNKSGSSKDSTVSAIRIA